MSKKIIKSFILFTILILLCTFSFATDETALLASQPSDNIVATIGTNDVAENTATEGTATSENISYGDIYKFEDKITINGTIDGNLFLFGKDVTIEDGALIGGDIFVCAGNLNIGKAVVYGNIFAWAKNITLNVETYDLYATCENLDIGYYSLFHRDVKAVCNSAKINGVILKNINLSCNNIEIQKDCLIYENLNYNSKTEIAEIPEGTVQGSVNFKASSTIGTFILSYAIGLLSILASSTTGTFILSYAIGLLSILAYSLLVWFLMKKVTPKFINKASNLKISQVFIALGIGVATLIVVPLVSLLLLFTYVGVTIAFALLAIYFLVISISLINFVIAISGLVKSKLQKGKDIIYILLGTILVYVLTNIPYVGWIFCLLTALIGLGIFTISFFIKTKEE